MTLNVLYTKKDLVIVDCQTRPSRSVSVILCHFSLVLMLSFDCTQIHTIVLMYISHSQPVQVTRPSMTLTLEAQQEDRDFPSSVGHTHEWFCVTTRMLAVLSGLGTTFGLGQIGYRERDVPFPPFPSSES